MLTRSFSLVLLLEISVMHDMFGVLFSVNLQ